MTLSLQRQVIDSVSSGSTIGNTVTGSGTANTKGAWQQLLPATAFEAYILHVKVFDVRVSTVNTALLLDIGIDPAGGTTYSVLVPNLAMGFGGTIEEPHQDFAIPVFIPAGSTVAGRLQSVVTSETATVAIALGGSTPRSDPFVPRGLVVAYGDNTADSGGVTLINAAADTKAAWVEITSATTHPHSGIALALQGNGTVMSNLNLLVDIGIGAASSEVVIVGDIYLRGSAGEQIGSRFPCAPIVAIAIPEGSRLAVRAQTENANRQDQYDAVLYGWG